jgi:hypothetical protein
MPGCAIWKTSAWSWSIPDERPDLSIGVGFVNAAGKPGWIGDDRTLRVHAPSVRGCWPTVHGVE